MIDFPIVDAHLHIWDRRRVHYPWLKDSPTLNRDFLPEDYRQACGPVEVEAMVFVQCEADFSQAMAEAEWVTELAGQDPRIKGIIPWAPLEKGEAARPKLEKLAQNKLVKGIRRIIEFEPDSNFCLRPDFVRGVQALPDYGFSFDINIAHHQMPNTIRLVEQCPASSSSWTIWASPTSRIACWSMAAGFAHAGGVSQHPVQDVGPGHRGRPHALDSDDLRPYIDHALECFGLGRVMFGGDWPVATQATQYPRWVETLAWALNEYSPRNKGKSSMTTRSDFTGWHPRKINNQPRECSNILLLPHH